MYVFMYVCIYADTCVCMFVCLCACMSAIHVQMRCMHVCMIACMHVHALMYVYIYLCFCASMQVSMYVCMHVCMYAPVHNGCGGHLFHAACAVYLAFFMQGVYCIFILLVVHWFCSKFECWGKIEWHFANKWVKMNENEWNWIKLSKNELMFIQFDSMSFMFIHLLAKFHSILLKQSDFE